jgi:hypothetical protein
MKTNKTMIAGAALAGILTGGFAAKAAAASQDGSQKNGAAFAAGMQAADEKADSHDCKGKNSCKGKGGCKGSDNGCNGKNSCKGKGGCASKHAEPEKK